MRLLHQRARDLDGYVLEGGYGGAVVVSPGSDTVGRCLLEREREGRAREGMQLTLTKDVLGLASTDSCADHLRQEHLELQVRSLLQQQGIDDPFIDPPCDYSIYSYPVVGDTEQQQHLSRSYEDCDLGPSEPPATRSSPPICDGDLNQSDPDPTPHSSPSRSPNMAAPNGMQPGGGAPYGLGSAIMPSAGHHQDMAHVWGLVEQLSGILHENRERWEELQSGIARAQVENSLRSDTE